MSRNLTPKLKAKRNFSASILPLATARSFQLSVSPSPLRDYIPIVVLLFLLHFIITGRIIPELLVSTVTFLSAPVISLLSNHGPPSSIIQLMDTKFLGTTPQFGLTNQKYVIPEKLKYIFPRVEDIAFLKEVGYDKLFDVEDNDGSNKKTYIYSPDYFEFIDESAIDADNADDEKEGEEKDLKTAKALSKQDKTIVNSKYDKAIANFKRNGHRVYKGNENPEIVIVTTLNYEKLSSSLITKIIQNRINYAYQNSYGFYSRYAQEFIPLFVKGRNDLDNWSRLVTLKEAMIAFPNAKWFWYVDEKTLIMRDDIDIKNFILKHEALDPIILRGQSILPPNGQVKTYENVDVDRLSFLISQTNTGLNTDSFLVKNDFHGRALIDIWNDRLMRSYSLFRKDISKPLGHILQWHPLLLERTGLLPPRTIASVFTPTDETGKLEDFNYQAGDLVMSFPKCKEVGNCEQMMTLVDTDVEL